MKKIHRIAVILLSIAMVFAMLPLQSQAAKKKYNLKQEVSHWGIRGGRPFTTPIYYKGLTGAKSATWTVTRPNITKIPKKDAFKMVFTVTMTNMSDFSGSQVDAILANNEEGGWLKCMVLDQKTGKLFTKQNKDKVKVKTKVLGRTKIDNYLSSDQRTRFYPVRRYKARVTVTFPDNFNGNRLCLGIGTYRKVPGMTRSDRRFRNGKLRIDQTKMFQGYGENFHFTNLIKMSGAGELDYWFVDY